MNQDYLIKLCLAVYKVTGIFPKEEPLKFLIREKANQILADLLSKEKPGKIKKDIELINGYFEIAEKQNWVDELNFLVLRREYAKIKGEEEEGLKSKKGSVSPIIGQKKPKPVGRQGNLSERCGKILEILRQKERAQVWEFKKIFPEVTKRTLRRDFEFLLKQGLVERAGEDNNIYYKMSR